MVRPVDSTETLMLTPSALLRRVLPKSLVRDCTLSDERALQSRTGRERVFNTPLTEQGIAGFGIGDHVSNQREDQQ